MNTCANCRHSEPTVCDDRLELVLCCRRYPPQVFVLGDDICCSWPQIDASECCGEWSSSEVRRIQPRNWKTMLGLAP